MFRRLARSPDTLVAAVVPLSCLGLLVEAYHRTDLSEAEPAGDCTPNTLCQSLSFAQPRPDLLVVPNAVPASVVAQVRTELLSRGAWTSTGNDTDVRQDQVRWVRADDDDDDSTALNECIRFLRGIPHIWGADDLLVVPRQCQLAVYRGDGQASYVRHLDQCPDSMYDLGLLEYWRLQDYRRRRLTAILYLNDPERSAAEGGTLRCWVPNVEDGFDAPVDIVPQGGTLVIFDSTRYVQWIMMTVNKFC